MITGNLNHRGTSYIEIMLAILMAALLVAGYTRVMTSSTKIMVNSTSTTNAISWLNYTTESMRILSYDSLPSGVWVSSATDTLLGEGLSKTLGESRLTYSRIIAVTTLYAGSAGALKAIEIYVTWNEGNETKKVKTNTMLTNKVVTE